MLQFEFRDNKVNKILNDAKTLQRKVGLEIGKKVRQRMNQLQSAKNFNEYLTKVQIGKPHQLEGEFSRCFAISITANYRLIVEPLNTNLDLESLKKCEVLDIKGVLDYHGGKNEWIIP